MMSRAYNLSSKQHNCALFYPDTSHTIYDTAKKASEKAREIPAGISRSLFRWLSLRERRKDWIKDT